MTRVDHQQNKKFFDPWIGLGWGEEHLNNRRTTTMEFVLDDNAEILVSVRDRTSLTIPKTVRRIHPKAFKACSSLVSIALPEGLEEIGERSFQHCTSLTSLTIPTTVRRIKKRAFAECSSLVSIELPEGLEEIEECSFQDCRSLTSLTIPTTVRKIHPGAFSGCPSLLSIQLPIGLTAPFDASRIFDPSCMPMSIRLSIGPTRYFELLSKDDIPKHDENRDLVLRGQWSTEMLRVFQAAHVLVYKTLPLRHLAMFVERCNGEPDAIFYFLSQTYSQLRMAPSRMTMQQQSDQN